MTTAANGGMAPIHEQDMPVMLMTPEEVDRWLEGTVANVLELQRPAPDDAIVVRMDEAA
jgi:putative SOS response-associated peptidase YedK